MAITKERLQIVIEALNMSKKEMKRLQKDLEGVEGKSKDSTSQVNNMRSTLNSLAIVAGTVTGAIFTMKKAFDFAEQGAQIERLEESGQRLATQFGQDMEGITDSIVSASGHTIDRMTAMSVANNAMILDVAKSPAEFEKLTKAAVALGRATGRTAAQSIQDLTTGVGRQSRMILDNLGIVMNAEKDYGAYAEQIGKTASELTDAEKKQALLNKAIEAAQPLLDEQGNLAGDAASEYEELKAEWKDFTAELKKGASKALTPSIKKHNEAKDAISAMDEALARGLITQGDYIASQIRLRLKAGDANIVLERMNGLIDGQRNAIMESEDPHEKFIQNTYRYSDAGREALGVTGEMTEEAKAYAAAQLEASKNTKSLLDNLDRDIASPIESYIKDLEWFIATGGQIEQAFTKVQKLVEEEAITPELGIELSQELLKGAIDVQEEIGTVGIDEAAQSLSDNFNMELEEAKKLISGTEGIEGAMERIDQVALEAEGISSFRDDMENAGSELRSISSRSWVVNIVLDVQQQGDIKVPSSQVDQITEEMMNRLRGVQ